MPPAGRTPHAATMTNPDVEEDKEDCPPECEECGRTPVDADDREAWRFYPSRVGGFTPYCPECALREFGPPAA
jgi:hypothetical protein